MTDLEQAAEALMDKYDESIKAGVVWKNTYAPLFKALKAALEARQAGRPKGLTPEQIRMGYRSARFLPPRG